MKEKTGNERKNRECTTPFPGNAKTGNAQQGIHNRECTTGNAQHTNTNPWRAYLVFVCTRGSDKIDR
jgi:hypothetical protein